MNICSQHKLTSDPECRLCKSTPEDLFGKEFWETAKKQALAAGSRNCVNCNFKFYRTTNMCPSCSKDHSEID